MLTKMKLIVFFISVFISSIPAYGQKDFYHQKKNIPRVQDISTGDIYFAPSEVPTTAYTFAFSPSGYVFAGTNGGILRSEDNGITWEYFPVSPDNHYYVKSLVFTLPSKLFAGGGKGGLMLPSPPEIPPLSLSGSNDDDDESETVIDSYGGVFVSTDNGSTWKQYINILNSVRVTSLAVNKQEHLFAGAFEDCSIYYSTDSSKSWKKLVEWQNGNLVRDIVINSQGYIFAGTDIGIYRSTDNGKTWEAWSNNINDKDIIDLSISVNGYLLAVTGSGELYSSFVEENWWKKIDIKPGILFYAAVFDSKFNIYAGTNQGVFVYSTFGDTWGNPTTFDNKPQISIYSLAVKDPGAITTCFVGTEDEIYTINYGYYTIKENRFKQY